MNGHKLLNITLRRHQTIRFFSLSLNLLRNKSTYNNIIMESITKKCEVNPENQKLPKKYYRRAEHRAMFTIQPSVSPIMNHEFKT
ncbi:hypothetical protein HW555_001134 [Spodoptera exigua]|uniref:Uncharacterized protein n=1 Tax=Spodoptera exigua TaxID=7107 RepID=A0A835LAS6_SPOEX|nr:hypothetical protein HW555_001134 [Spodoptera exigua]